MGSMKKFALGMAAMLAGRAKYSGGMGFLPTRRALGYADDGAKGPYCVESGDGEVLAVDLSLWAARTIARQAHNQPGALKRGARVRDQRTGVVLLSGVGTML
jgi:hypothetical protein